MRRGLFRGLSGVLRIHVILQPAQVSRGLVRTMTWAVLVACLVWTSAMAQSPAMRVLPGSSTQANLAAGVVTAAASLETRLAEARAQLAALGNVPMTAQPAGISSQDVSTRRAGLNRLVRLYEQQASNAAMLEIAKIRRADTAREAQGWTRFSDPPPYSVLLTDRLREEIQTERQKIVDGEASLVLLNQLIEENRDTLEQAEERLRQFNEQLERARDPALTARLSWQRDMERLRSQVAAATVALLDLERSASQESLAECRIRLGLLQRQVIFAQAGAQFTQADLESVISQIERQREQLESELAEAQPRRASALQALATAQEQRRLRQGREEDGVEASDVMEAVRTREAQLDAADTTISLLRLMLEAASVERAMWEMRFAVHDTRSAATLRESERRLAASARRVDLWRRYARQQLEALGNHLQLQEARCNELSAASPLLPLARERLDALRERERMLLRLVRTADHMHRLAERWAEGLRDAEQKLPFGGRLRNVFTDARTFLQRLWAFEIFTAEDTITVDGQKITGKRGVTIGKIAMAVVILVVGYWLTGLATGFVEPIAVKRLKIEPNQASLVRRWLRAFLVLCLLLFSLVSVKIPLTAFAFAGGALAIGLGFGMQNVLKNFVSGLILLFERPFRVGDVLDVGGQQGIVSSIGLRASVLQLWDGTETLIPNSSLLENNVSNWTYSNRRVRFSVHVGVSFSSDLRRVTQVLADVVERHGLVEKDPKPIVLLTAFGDSTLNFEVRFWVDVTKVNSAQVSSDLRLMIARVFAENGIVIDYPQLQLRAGEPIQVDMVPPTSAPVDGGRCQ
ncbi:MAG: mechanosensitive ion channel domain-containing protein [Verrucomicrobiia bacterium]